jgi:hypothetical protein
LRPLPNSAQSIGSTPPIINLACPVVHVSISMDAQGSAGWSVAPVVSKLTAASVAGGQLMCRYDSITVVHATPAGRQCTAQASGFQCQIGSPPKTGGCPDGWAVAPGGICVPRKG